MILLHGGLGNSDYWGNLIPALAEHTRSSSWTAAGTGAAPGTPSPTATTSWPPTCWRLMDFLKLPKADIVGWSDGGIIGLDIAMNHPDRIGKLFAFGANSNLAGLKDGFDKNPNFAAFIERAGKEYAQLSPTPDRVRRLPGADRRHVVLAAELDRRPIWLGSRRPR